MRKIVARTGLIFLASVAMATFAKAALPSPSSAVSVPTKAISQQQLRLTVMALHLPFKNRQAALKKQGVNALGALNELAFNKRQPLQMRWQALLALGRLAPKQAHKALVRAVKSKAWYMRNAGILAMSYGDRDQAIQWAKRLLSDKALVVRTGAVQTLDKVGAIEAEDLLWKKLNAPENFRHGKSLWIRKYIARTLSRFAHKGQEGRFIKILADQDVRLHPYAVLALRRITGRALVPHAKSFKEQRQAWLQWWQSQGS